tara:strand:- start:543 stop:1673 length:1131 start_codon:yes stop_codon:yes gene_type:complete
MKPSANPTKSGKMMALHLRAGQRLVLRAACVRAMPLSSKIPKPFPGQVPRSDVQYGKKVANDEHAASQGLHAMGAGRYQYVADFWKSLNRGKVRLDIGEKPLSEEEQEQQRVQDQAFGVIKNSMIYGTLMVAVGGAIGWMVTKRVLGVQSIGEFGEHMSERLPKVSGKLEDSALGRQLQEESDYYKEAISGSERLTTWRRSMRSKFNSEEGAELARKNSMMLADFRQMEKEERRRRKGEREARERLAAERERARERDAAGGDRVNVEGAAADACDEVVSQTLRADAAPLLEKTHESPPKIKRRKSAVASEIGVIEHSNGPQPDVASPGVGAVGQAGPLASEITDSSDKEQGAVSKLKRRMTAVASKIGIVSDQNDE